MAKILYNQRTVVSFIFLTCILLSGARKLEVRSFEPVPLDLSASTESRLDNNGCHCALLKIVSPDASIAVQGNVIGNIDKTGSEYWCYLTPGSKSVKIIPDDYEPLFIKFEDFGITGLVSKSTYSLVLDNPDKPTANVHLSKEYQDIKLRKFKISDYRVGTELWMAVACELNGKQVFYSHSTWMRMEEADKDKHTVLGVLLPSASNFFIVSCRDESSHMYRWEEAMKLFAERLPSEDECDIISHSTMPLCESCITLDQAIRDYGGELVSGIYWGYEDGNKSRYELEDNQAVMMMVERDGVGNVLDADNGWYDKTGAAKVRLVIGVK